MSFKVKCEACSAEGRIIHKKGVSVFSNTVRGEGAITITYGEEGGYDIEIKCTQCGNKVED